MIGTAFELYSLRRVTLTELPTHCKWGFINNQDEFTHNQIVSSHFVLLLSLESSVIYEHMSQLITISLNQKVQLQRDEFEQMHHDEISAL